MYRLKPFALMTTLLLLIFVTTLSPVASHQGAKGIVKERMDAMKSIGKAMKKLGAMARGKSPLDQNAVRANARIIEQHGVKIPSFFPAGTGHGMSEASPEIWKNPVGFKKASEDMIAAARNAAQSANNIDDLKRAFRQLGKSCSGCHKQFRIKKKRRH